MLLHPLIRDASRPAIDALDDATRGAMASHWRRRAASERRIGVGFAQIAPRLAALGATPALVDLCARSAEQEAAHAELCRDLAGLYRGVDEPPIADVEVDVPIFGHSDERVELALLVLGTCCINETLATAYLSLCLATSSAPCAVAANRAHLREEIDHGRLGWALLASRFVDDRLRDALAPCLAGMLAANVPLWLRADPFLPSAGVPGFGHPAHNEVRAAIERAVVEIVIPGFAHVGLDVEDLDERWRSLVVA